MFMYENINEWLNLTIQTQHITFVMMLFESYYFAVHPLEYTTNRTNICNIKSELYIFRPQKLKY